MKLDRVITVRNSKTVYRDGDICIKVFDKNYDKTDILNEALNQARAEKTSLLVPEIKQFTETGGKWTIVSSYIKGKTLDRLIFENPDKSDEYIDLFAALHAKLHLQKASGFASLKDKMDLKIRSAPLPEPVKDSLLSKLAGLTSSSKNVLCHGDFALDNIIITGEGSAYILDWAHACTGSAAADVSWSYLQLWLKRNAKTAAQYVNLYCKKTGTQKQYIKDFIPLAAAAHISGAAEKEREFLLSWIK